jgi:hypothetical protein
MFKDFFSKIGGLLKQLGSLIYNGVQYADEHSTGFEESIQRIIDDINEFSANFNQLKEFDFDPKWKTRVISVPAAIDAIQDLFFTTRDELVSDYNQLREAVIEVRQAFGSTKPSLGSLDPSGAQSNLTKIVNTIGNMSVAMNQLANAFDAITDVETLANILKQKIEGLDPLFLPQAKSRKWLTERTYKRV